MSYVTTTVRLRSATPVFLVGDIEMTMQWYQRTLGFTAEPFPDVPPHAFCILRRDDVVIFLQQLTGYQKPDLYDEREGGVWSAYVRTDGVESFYQTLEARNDVTV